MRTPWVIPLLVLLPASLFAGRPLPPVAEAVTVAGIRYSVAVVRTDAEFGADLLAERLEDSTLLSRTPVYRIRYKPNAAKDSQEIFPVSLAVTGDGVIVTAEDDRRYRVSLTRP